jgi:hypothetical protein
MEFTRADVYRFRYRLTNFPIVPDGIASVFGTRAWNLGESIITTFSINRQDETMAFPTPEEAATTQRPINSLAGRNLRIWPRLAE